MHWIKFAPSDDYSARCALRPPVPLLLAALKAFAGRSAGTGDAAHPITTACRMPASEASGGPACRNFRQQAPVGKFNPPAGSNGIGDDLRSLIGVNPGLKRAEIPRLPAMSLRGFVQPHGGPPQALLEISELNRVFLVQEGTEIPITVAGSISPVGRAELTGLGRQRLPAKAPTPQAHDAQGQSQIILTVVKISNEGVTVKAGLMAQTMIIR